MTIEELMNLQAEFDKAHKGKFDWNEKIDDGNIEMLEFLLISMFGEIGETANLVKKSVRGDFPLSFIKDNLSEEITDIFIYLIKICNQLDINLEKSYLEKRKKNIERFRKYEKSDL
jgi:NTP pyrophosphatase (non-canonical NTP hydrolase)